MIKFQIAKHHVHEDWDEDGVEEGPKRGTWENLWRLDFVYKKSEYQAQLFCQIADNVPFRGFDNPTYESARLLVERDNRLIGRSDVRYDYAYNVRPITPVDASCLLWLDTSGVLAYAADQIQRTAELPRDTVFVLKCARSQEERDLIRQYWAWEDGVRIQEELDAQLPALPRGVR